MKPSLSHILPLVALVSLGGLAPLSAADNLLDNGDFQAGTTRWWGEGLEKGGAEEGFLRLEGGFACQDKVAIEPGKTYRISLRIKPEGAEDGSVFVQLSFRGEDLPIRWYGDEKVSLGDREEPALIVTGGTKDWKEFTAEYEAPQNATQLLLYLRKIPGTKGSASYDDVSVTAK
jgi:hypothetical protein